MINLILIIILFFILYHIKNKENLINPRVFTKGILSGDDNLKKEIKLLRNMQKCIHNKNHGFYPCINSLNIKREPNYKIIKKTKQINYLKHKKTSDLELQSFD